MGLWEKMRGYKVKFSSACRQELSGQRNRWGVVLESHDRFIHSFYVLVGHVTKLKCSLLDYLLCYIAGLYEFPTLNFLGWAILHKETPKV